ncbi:hypothetical protein [Thermococcus sp.]|uniref:hypothetical protein n=1 Tax=Thermococcus sp. TaxID=35749 RepID=UPI001986CB0D|nr:hypothetical protein [Thermococcus sp.]MBC7094869.1 hypothetical protein [Thermococcus sp.]
MVFDPDGFFRLAEILESRDYKELERVNSAKEGDKNLQNLEEALFRTIISRLYYYVFLTFREIIKKQIKEHNPYLYDTLEYKSFWDDHRIHGFVADVLSEISSDYGGFIKSLRRLRNDADYRLEKIITENEINKARSIVNKLINELNLISQELESIVDSDRIGGIILEYLRRDQTREGYKYDDSRTYH